MNRDRVVSDEPIDLDPNELLGLSQIAKVSEGLANQALWTGLEQGRS